MIMQKKSYAVTRIELMHIDISDEKREKSGNSDSGKHNDQQIGTPVADDDSGNVPLPGVVTPVSSGPCSKGSFELSTSYEKIRELI